MTSYAELHKGLQEGSLPIVEDRSGLVYNPLSLIEVNVSIDVSMQQTVASMTIFLCGFFLLHARQYVLVE